MFTHFSDERICLRPRTDYVVICSCNKARFHKTRHRILINDNNYYFIVLYKMDMAKMILTCQE